MFDSPASTLSVSCFCKPAQDLPTAPSPPRISLSLSLFCTCPLFRLHPCLYINMIFRGLDGARHAARLCLAQKGGIAGGTDCATTFFCIVSGSGGGAAAGNAAARPCRSELEIDPDAQAITLSSVDRCSPDCIHTRSPPRRTFPSKKENRGRKKEAPSVPRGERVETTSYPRARVSCFGTRTR